MTKHYVFTKCTGPIELDEGVKVNVMHNGDAGTITCMGGQWYWSNDIPVTDWDNISVLTEVEGEKDWKDECDRLGKAAQYWQSEYYKVVGPNIVPVKLDDKIV